MTTKANIFNSLPQHNSDSEDEGHNKNSNKNNDKKGPRVRKTGKGIPPKDADVSTKRAKELRNLDAKQTIQKRKESDLDHPHQLDRHSGTGVSAFDKREKKGGSGPHNWGDYRQDRKFNDRNDRDNEEQEAAPQEEEDKTITFEEYSQRAGQQTKQQKNETKAKISDDQLLKELGKATKLETRKQREINEHQKTHVKRSAEEHNVVPNTEFADILGFRTGFKIYDDSAPRKPRGPRPDGTERKEDGKTAEEGGEAPVVNNEVVAAEQGDAAAGEKVEADKKADSPSAGRGRGGRGGQRGGNRGGEGDHRGGNRGGEGDNRGPRPQRGGYAGGKKPESKGFNPDDESSFPKLG